MGTYPNNFHARVSAIRSPSIFARLCSRKAIPKQWRNLASEEVRTRFQHRHSLSKQLFDLHSVLRRPTFGEHWRGAAWTLDNFHSGPLCNTRLVLRGLRTACVQHEGDETKTATLRASSHVHVVLRVDSLDLGVHVVIGVGRLNVQQDGFTRQLHFTTHTQHQVQSFFLLDVVVRLCPVIVH